MEVDFLEDCFYKSENGRSLAYGIDLSKGKGLSGGIDAFPSRRLCGGHSTPFRRVSSYDA